MNIQTNIHSDVNINEILNKTKSKFDIQINDSILFDLLFETHRYFDKQFVELLHHDEIVLKQDYRDRLRLYFYYGSKSLIEDIVDIPFHRYQATVEDKAFVLNSFLYRCEKYDEKKIVYSIEEKYTQIINNSTEDNYSKWLDYYEQKRQSNSDFSLFVMNYSMEDYVKDNYDINQILNRIAKIYDRLENYRHFVFLLNGTILNEENEDITWRLVYKIGIFCENFIQFKGKFSPYKKNKQIKILQEYLDEKFSDNKDNNLEIAQNFYKDISTGFVFEDCLVSDTQNAIVLIYKKIKLDTSSVPCPVCNTTIQSGNSFPLMFLRSYECKNPSCKQRSKSGRGKRFDEYGVYRYLKLIENNKDNIIEEDLYKKWRRDVFSSNNDVFEMILKYYAWAGERVCIFKNAKISDTYNRIVIYYKDNLDDTDTQYNFDNLPICKLFDGLKNILVKRATTGTLSLQKDIEIINDNSTNFLQKLLPNQVGCSITSPPYYNAREYSTWTNILLYLIDMMDNAKSVYDVLQNNGYYFYNIGDIVDRDNLYVNSNMSKKRLQLGFLSCLFFEKLGYNLVGNIIWDKGEVQSKRNSTLNHFSGYVKCINCYEHVFIFKKGRENKYLSGIKKITPVIKINSKGENLYRHSAPYPMDLVNLINPFVDKDKYVLDSFLGSGTTLKWCQENNYKGIGIELNNNYYLIAKENLNFKSLWMK